MSCRAPGVAIPAVAAPARASRRLLWRRLASRRGAVRYAETINPGTGEVARHRRRLHGRGCRGRHRRGPAGFETWRRVAAARTRAAAEAHGRDPARACGRACHARRCRLRQSGAEMVGDAMIAAAQMEFFAGFVTEMKGASIPMGPDAVNFSVREPMGVIGAHHPLQPSVHVLRGQVGRPARGRQYGDRQAAGPGAAVLAASRRAARRRAAAGRLQRRAGRQGSRRGARRRIPASPRSR